MEVLTTVVATAWVLFLLAAIGLYAPAVALGSVPGRQSIALEMGPGLVWTWLSIAVATPLIGSVRGFNWFTALLIATVWPVMLWLFRHRGEYQSAFNAVVRRLVYRIVDRNLPPPSRPRLEAAVVLALPLLALWRLVPGQADPRLQMPGEFDTLWRTRQLLDGATAWEPLAALTAVLTRISSTDALAVTGALRLALVVCTAAAAGLFIAETSRRWWAGVAVATFIVAAAPSAAGSLWAVALAGCVGLTSAGRWIREERARDGWHAVAAVALLAGQLAPFAGAPRLLLAISRAPQYLESPAASHQAQRLARSERGDDWMVVAPPEQRLGLGADGRSYDLAQFVSRFQDRAGQASFRFDLRARRLFVFVEKPGVEPAAPSHGVQFVAAQLAAYRVPRERMRLQRLAMRVCDEYRRTHAGANIIYDDDQLRVYRFDV